MKIINLEKKMGNFTLEIDCLDIEPGKVHGLVGHNGCGKTILLKTIMGILEPDGGRIDFEGIDRRNVTMMTQRPYLLHDTVYENVIYPLKIRSMAVGEKKVDELLEKVGLLAQKKQYARSLSSGERQKLSFLRAVIFAPEFVIMDETLSNMDPESESVIIDFIREIQKTRPITWLIVNHQLEQKKNLCDVIHYMEKGKIKYETS
ncbi:MAG: ATP-binding cassette domain-containing protein [Firmicutes bacterium]|nr:ATP-binding cassette domain-containing protein [Bacillota bacterium]